MTYAAFFRAYLSRGKKINQTKGECAMKSPCKIFIVAGSLSLAAALLHVAVIFGGPNWYRFFGAGEQLAQMAEAGMAYPIFVTLFITSILTGWGLYALSGAGLILRLPFLRTCLVLITAVYCIRGAYGPFIPLLVSTPYVENLGIAFWFWSSAICMSIGLLHLWGLKRNWSFISQKR